MKSRNSFRSNKDNKGKDSPSDAYDNHSGGNYSPSSSSSQYTNSSDEHLVIPKIKFRLNGQSNSKSSDGNHSNEKCSSDSSENEDSSLIVARKGNSENIEKMNRSNSNEQKIQSAVHFNNNHDSHLTEKDEETKLSNSTATTITIPLKKSMISDVTKDVEISIEKSDQNLSSLFSHERNQKKISPMLPTTSSIKNQYQQESEKNADIKSIHLKSPRRNLTLNDELVKNEKSRWKNEILEGKRNKSFFTQFQNEDPSAHNDDELKKRHGYEDNVSYKKKSESSSQFPSTINEDINHESHLSKNIKRQNENGEEQTDKEFIEPERIHLWEGPYNLIKKRHKLIEHKSTLIPSSGSESIQEEKEFIEWDFYRKNYLDSLLTHEWNQIFPEMKLAFNNSNVIMMPSSNIQQSTFYQSFLVSTGSSETYRKNLLSELRNNILILNKYYKAFTNQLMDFINDEQCRVNRMTGMMNDIILSQNNPLQNDELSWMEKCLDDRYITEKTIHWSSHLRSLLLQVSFYQKIISKKKFIV